MIRLPQRRVSQQGFTLVELSIVIAIIGLVVGGITGGQYLYKQAELQSVMTDLNKFKTAYTQFKDQYKGPPGDITDAVDYWGADALGTAACPSGAAVPKKATCNGDGDGKIDLSADTAEIWRAWQQLANANMIDGSYTGVVGPAGTRDSVPGENVPAGKRSNTGYSIFWIPSVTATGSDQYAGDYGTVLNYGGYVSAEITKGPALTTREALQIDTKMDDGVPGTGNIYSNRVTSDKCVTDQTYSAGSTAAYAVANAGLHCMIGYKLDQ